MAVVEMPRAWLATGGNLREARLAYIRLQPFRRVVHGDTMPAFPYGFILLCIIVVEHRVKRVRWS